MANDYYTPSGTPGTGSQGASASMRSEFALLQTAFDKLPALSGNGDEFVVVNSGGSALTSITASAARTALGLEIGTNIQAYDAELTAIAGLTSAADKGIYFTGSGAAAVFDLSGVGRTLVGQSTQALMRTTGLGMSANASTFVAAADYSAMRTALGVAIGTDVQAYDADTAKLDVEDQALTGGVIVTSKSLGTVASGTVTPDPGDRPLQHYTNGGAHTLAPSSNAGSMIVDVTNDGSAGAITTSGFTKVTGDAFTTTNGHKFRCVIVIGNAGSLLNVTAMQ